MADVILLGRKADDALGALIAPSNTRARYSLKINEVVDEKVSLRADKIT